MSDSSKEMAQDVLNNARNSLVNNFKSIKWFYLEVINVKDKMNNLEDMANIQKSVDLKTMDGVNTVALMDMVDFYKLEVKVLDLYNMNLRL